MAGRVPMDPPVPGSKREELEAAAAAAAAARGEGVTVSPGRPSGFVTGNQTPHRPSPTVPVYTAAYGGGDGTYGSPRPVGLPTNVAMDELQDGVTPQVMTPELKKYLQQLADHMGHNRTPNGVWQNAIEIANREGITVMGAVYAIADDAGFRPSAGTPADEPGADPTGPRGSGPGGGGYSGPSYSYSQINEATLEDLANQIGMTMVGRGVTDAELAKILKRVRKVEARNPQVTSSNGAGSSTTQQGVTDSDRQDVIENILARNPQYGDYQKATTMMDWFGNALNARLQNV